MLFASYLAMTRDLEKYMNWEFDGSEVLMRAKARGHYFSDQRDSLCVPNHIYIFTHLAKT